MKAARKSSMHKLTTREIVTDKTIRLRFEGGAWASMTFQHNHENDWWNVTINSDWGNWSYGWSRSGMGSDIFEFMGLRGDRSYFINKFCGYTEIFNIEKTMTALRKMVREEYPWITNREKNEELMYLVSELSSCENADQVYYQIDKELSDLCQGEIWHLFKYEWHPREKYFFTKIFPKFFPEIRKIAKENKKLVGEK